VRGGGELAKQLSFCVQVLEDCFHHYRRLHALLVAVHERDSP
jgi:hypothetical protein